MENCFDLDEFVRWKVLEIEMEIGFHVDAMSPYILDIFVGEFLEEKWDLTVFI